MVLLNHFHFVRSWPDELVRSGRGYLRDLDLAPYISGYEPTAEQDCPYVVVALDMGTRVRVEAQTDGPTQHLAKWRLL